MLVLLYSLIYTGRFFFPVGERERKERVGLAHNNPPIREDAQGSRARTCTIAIEFSHLSLSLSVLSLTGVDQYTVRISLSPLAVIPSFSLCFSTLFVKQRERENKSLFRIQQLAKSKTLNY